MNKKPVIGIILDVNNDSEKYSYAKLPWYALRKGYADAVESAGGLPIMLPYNHDIESTLALIDGLIIPGCDEDINPKFYDQEIKSDKVKTKDIRTEYEIDLTNKALAKNMPIFGICNGMQLINVIFGGTLLQHIPDQYITDLNHEQPAPKHIPSHSVIIKEGTILSTLSPNAEVMVSSTHHQAVEILGKELIVSAVASDGIIEAIESTKHRFLVCVQWHSEYLNSDLDRNLFKRLVAESSLI